MPTPYNVLIMGASYGSLLATKLLFDRIVEEHSVQKKVQLAAEGTDIVGRAIQQVRTISYLLHPPLLDESGLASALKWYLDGIEKRSGIKTSLEVQPQNLFDLSHGLSLSGQLRSALLGPINDHPWLKSSAAIFPFSSHSDHCSPLSITPGPGRPRSDRLQRRTLIAFTGEH